MGLGLTEIIAPVAGGLVGDVIGGVIDQKEGNKNRNQIDQTNQLNADLQREFAKNSIRWKIEDAAAAGIHPLAALGAQGYSASPSYIAPERDTSMSNMARSMGQNINRAVMATMTASERQMKALQLENMKLENESLKNRVESEKRLLSQVGPSFPSMSNDPYLQGQGDKYKSKSGDPRVLDNPLTRTVSDPYDSSKEAGSITDYNLAKTPRGYTIIPSADMKQRIEDDWLAEQQWKLRTYKAVLKGQIRLPNGKKATINPITGEMSESKSSFRDEVIDKFLDGPFGLFK